MDIELAKTFLEITNTGSFIGAADRLHVSQTAVSARVKSLEEQLGCALFVRNRSGARLSPAGEQFFRYAQSLVQIWERARHQVAIPPGRTAVLAIGGELSLWNPILLDWLVQMRETVPSIAVRAHVALPDQLLDQVTEGVLDMAVLYAPRVRPGLKIELLTEEKLVLVTTTNPSAPKTEAESDNYVYVDWGPQFSAQHNARFPGKSDAGLFVNLGPLGLNYIVATGGVGYFRVSAIKPYLEKKHLFLVDGAPEFSYPAYVVYPESADARILEPALDTLRRVCSKTKSISSSSRSRRKPAGRRNRRGKS